ncbi:MAG: hypothetical protein AB7L13_02230 [Acidimicrobiia bacterium]
MFRTMLANQAVAQTVVARPCAANWSTVAPMAAYPAFESMHLGFNSKRHITERPRRVLGLLT